MEWRQREHLASVLERELGVLFYIPRSNVKMLYGSPLP